MGNAESDPEPSVLFRQRNVNQEQSHLFTQANVDYNYDSSTSEEEQEVRRQDLPGTSSMSAADKLERRKKHYFEQKYVRKQLGSTENLNRKALAAVSQ